MGSPEKKKQKAQAKALKKKAKVEAKIAKAKEKQGKKQFQAGQVKEATSPAVKFAEGVRGILYLILSVSMVIGIILSDRGYIITLEDIFDSLVAARIGKVILLTIAIALFIFGLKRLRAIK